MPKPISPSLDSSGPIKPLPMPPSLSKISLPPSGLLSPVGLSQGVSSGILGKPKVSALDQGPAVVSVSQVAQGGQTSAQPVEEIDEPATPRPPKTNSPYELTSFHPGKGRTRATGRLSTEREIWKKKRQYRNELKNLDRQDVKFFAGFLRKKADAMRLGSQVTRRQKLKWKGALWHKRKGAGGDIGSADLSDYKKIIDKLN